MKLKLHTIEITERSRLNYFYSYDKAISKFFSKNNPFFAKYSEDVSDVPSSILAIPFLANVLPISWFAGFDVEVEEIDAEFYQAMKVVKAQFAQYYPQIENKSSELIAGKIIQNKTNADFEKNAMLFSGGVDAYATYYRHSQENLDLITVRGADIMMDDKKQWQELLHYLENEEAIRQSNKLLIETNLREFLTHDVDRLIQGLGWWGKIQHGLALTCVCAPMAYKFKYKKLYIASSRSVFIPFSPWGSMPETDDKIRFSETEISHDSYDLSRMMKVLLIAEETGLRRFKPNLRVCYNEFKKDLNCNKCEKCCRTIFGLMCSGADPNLYGFNVDTSIYDDVSRNLCKPFTTAGTKRFWKEIIESVDFGRFYFFCDPEEEKRRIEKIVQLYHVNADKPIGLVSAKNLRKQQLISRFPKLFRAYLNLRMKLK